jgi:Flp pilus assembly protein protease CpaA
VAHVWHLGPGTGDVDSVTLWMVFFAALIGAATDLGWRRIPNALTLPLLAGGFCWQSWTGGTWGLADAAVGCCLLALPYLVLFTYFQGGGGDAKLMGGIGAWLGFIQGGIVLSWVAVLGAVLGVGYLAAVAIRQQIGIMPAGDSDDTPSSANADSIGGGAGPGAESPGRRPMPYGVAIFAGVCVWTLRMLA